MTVEYIPSNMTRYRLHVDKDHHDYVLALSVDYKDYSTGITEWLCVYQQGNGKITTVRSIGLIRLVPSSSVN